MSLKGRARYKLQKKLKASIDGYKYWCMCYINSEISFRKKELKLQIRLARESLSVALFFCDMKS